VRVVYKRLYSPAITAWSMGMLPELRMIAAALAREAERRGITGEALERVAWRQSESAQHPVGTGPYRFVEWQRGE
jgi:ABC-type transport system substrate-binding protein